MGSKKYFKRPRCTYSLVKNSNSYIFMILCWVLTISACTSLTTSTKKDRNIELEREAQRNIETDMLKAQTYFDKENYSEAIEVLKGIILKYPSSVSEQKIKVQIARNYYFQGEYLKSIETYREVIAATQTTQPEIASDALFLSSLSYEALGENSKTLAALKDSLRYRKYLSEERIFAEIPARMASIYQRMGEKSEAMAYLQMAERGSSQLRMRKNIDRAFFAKVYYQMSELHPQTITPGNITMHIESVQMLQLFSLKSIEAEDYTWSQMASKNLSHVYKTIWENIKSIPSNSTLDPVAAQKEKAEQQFKQAGNLLKVLQELKHYNLSKEKSNSPLLQQTMNFVENLGQEISKFMVSLGEYNSLTKESLERKSAKKNYILESDFSSTDLDENKSQVPILKKESQQEENLNQDPNL